MAKGERFYAELGTEMQGTGGGEKKVDVKRIKETGKKTRGKGDNNVVDLELSRRDKKREKEAKRIIKNKKKLEEKEKKGYIGGENLYDAEKIETADNIVVENSETREEKNGGAVEGELNGSEKEKAEWEEHLAALIKMHEKEDDGRTRAGLSRNINTAKNKIKEINLKLGVDIDEKLPETKTEESEILTKEELENRIQEFEERGSEIRKMQLSDERDDLVKEQRESYSDYEKNLKQYIKLYGKPCQVVETRAKAEDAAVEGASKQSETIKAKPKPADESQWWNERRRLQILAEQDKKISSWYKTRDEEKKSSVSQRIPSLEKAYERDLSQEEDAGIDYSGADYYKHVPDESVAKEKTKQTHFGDEYFANAEQKQQDEKLEAERKEENELVKEQEGGFSREKLSEAMVENEKLAIENEEKEKELIKKIISYQENEMKNLGEKTERFQGENIESESKILDLQKNLEQANERLAQANGRLKIDIEKNTSLQEKKGIAAFLKKNKKKILIISGLVGASIATGGLAGAGYALGSAGVGEIVRRKIESDEKKNVISDKEEKRIIDEAKNRAGEPEKKESAPNFLKKLTSKLARIFGDKENEEKPEVAAEQNQENKIDKLEAERIQKNLEQIDVFMNKFEKGEVSGEVVYATANDLAGWMKSESVSKEVKKAVKEKLFNMDTNIQAGMVISMLEYAMANNKDKAETFENLKCLTTRDKLEDIPGVSEEAKKWLLSEKESNNDLERLRQEKAVDDFFNKTETNNIRNLNSVEDFIRSLDSMEIRMRPDIQDNLLMNYYHHMIELILNNFDRRDMKIKDEATVGDAVIKKITEQIIKGDSSEKVKAFFDALFERFEELKKETKSNDKKPPKSPDSPEEVKVNAVVVAEKDGKKETEKETKNEDYESRATEIKKEIFEKAGNKDSKELAHLINNVESILDKEKEDGKGKLKDNIQEIKKSGYGKSKFVDESVVYLPANGEVVFIGDTHGDPDAAASVIEQEKFIESMEKGDKNKYLVFLGDYVDRGNGDVENIEQIMSLKEKYPDNVVLLRGNHETMESTSSDQFLFSLLAKYGDQNTLKSMIEYDSSFKRYYYAKKAGWQEKFKEDDSGKKLFEKYNKLFEKLPGAVVCGNGIIGVHGGIPNKDIKSLKDLNDKDALFQMRWNDPGWDNPYNPPNKLRDRAESSRGAGITKFSEMAFDKFMNVAGGKIMIRAHEQTDDYKEREKNIKFKNRLVTVFSTGKSKKGGYGGDAMYAKFNLNKEADKITIDDIMKVDYIKPDYSKSLIPTENLASSAEEKEENKVEKKLEVLKEKTDAKDASEEGIINELRTNKFRAGEEINSFLRKGEKRNDSKEFDRENLLKFVEILNEEIKNSKDIDSLYNMFGVASDALQYGRIDKESGDHAATFSSIFSDTRKITGEKLKTLIEKDKLPDDKIRETVKRMFWLKGDYVLDKNNKVSDILNELIQDKWGKGVEKKEENKVEKKLDKEEVILKALDSLDKNDSEAVKTRIKKANFAEKMFKVSRLKNMDSEIYEKYIKKMQDNLSKEEIEILENSTIGDVKKVVESL